jgi:hypothetical protein
MTLVSVFATFALILAVVGAYSLSRMWWGSGRASSGSD